MSEWLPEAAGRAAEAGALAVADEDAVDLDVLALGEVQVDLVAQGAESLSVASTFVRAPGGDPANVAAGVARLGRRAGLIGLVGADPFGRYLIRALHGYGVDTRYLGVHPRGRTPVVFVSQKAPADGAPPDPLRPGEKQFLHYPDGGAHLLLSPAWVPIAAVAHARVLVAGGVSLASPLPRAALLAALGHAAAAGVPVAFDVNWQPALWAHPERARDLYQTVLPQVDILQLSASELIMLTGGAASSEGGRLEAILHAWMGRLVVERARPLLLALTQGATGCTYGLWRPGGAGFEVVHLPACDIQVKDRTGAGAAFLAGLLVALLDRLAPLEPPAPAGPGPRLDLGALDVGAIGEIFTWANASGALATTRRGAMAALPERTRVLRLIKGRHGS